MPRRYRDSSHHHPRSHRLARRHSRLPAVFSASSLQSPRSRCRHRRTRRSPRLGHHTDPRSHRCTLTIIGTRGLVLALRKHRRSRCRPQTRRYSRPLLTIATLVAIVAAAFTATRRVPALRRSHRSRRCLLHTRRCHCSSRHRLRSRKLQRHSRLPAVFWHCALHRSRCRCTFVDVSAGLAITLETIVAAAFTAALGVSALRIYITAAVIDGALVDVITGLLVTFEAIVAAAFAAALGVATLCICIAAAIVVAHSSMSLQVSPSPSKPSLQRHSRLPAVFWHCAFASQPPLSTAHSSISRQLSPSPSKPSLQRHSRLPAVFWYWCIYVVATLSSALVYITDSSPSPSKPSLQRHQWLPAVFWHCALASQPPLSHSALVDIATVLTITLVAIVAAAFTATRACSGICAFGIAAAVVDSALVDIATSSHRHPRSHRCSGIRGQHRGVLALAAFTSQPPLSTAHSSISRQLSPSPS